MAMFRNVLGPVVAGLVIAGFAGAVVAQAQEDLVAKRRTAMVGAARSSGGLRAVAATGAITPEQAPAIKAEGDKIVAAFDLLKDPANWPKGTGKDDGASGSFAKAEVWTDAAGFAAAMDAAVKAAATVKAASDAADPAALKTAQAALQTTCNSCHSKYRAS
jgi:cytochrome c556